MSSPPPNNFTDEQVTQFMAFTGSSDPSRASSYLEMSGGDLETATSLYFEHNSGGSSSAGGGHHSRGSENAMFGGSGINDGGGMTDEVRAPDPTRRTRLMDFEGPSTGGFGQYPGGSIPNLNGVLPGGITEEMIRSIRAADAQMGGIMGNPMGNPFGVEGDASSSRFRDVINDAAEGDMEVESERNIGDQDDNDEIDVDDEVDSTMEPRQPSSRIRRLGDMFEAPKHLIFNQGGFQGARNMAKDSKRWLLVNLQSDEDFACHALNRDVWRNDLIENLIREGFIFWQCSNTEPDGQTYAQRYNVLFYPHIAIIDPRTGRQMWKKEGWTAENPLTASAFAESAADFCSHHSFDREPMVPRGMSGVSNSLPAFQSTDGTASAAAVATTEMTEEQQLAAAIAASMNPSSEETNDSDSDESVVVIDEVKVEETKPPNFEDEIISLEVGEEPSGTDNVARIMIRMPDGKRLIRKFLLGDIVKKVYAFIAQCNDDAKGGKQFECKFGFPPKDLRTCVDDTIESIGLAGDTITVRWK